MIDINLLCHTLPQLLAGLLVTGALTFCSLSFGLILTLLLVLAAYTRLRSLKLLVDAYTFVIRGTPLLIQIFIIYYGSGQLEWLRSSILWPLLKQPFICAVLALAINTSAYTFKLFWGVITALPKAEIQAGQALGMTKRVILRRIIIPRALRLVLPSYSNEVIIISKSTALASTITLMDLTGVMNRLIAQTYMTIPLLLVVAAIYLAIHALIIKCLRCQTCEPLSTAATSHNCAT